MKTRANKECTTCSFADFKRTKTGRRNLDQGECTAKVILPHSFADYRGDFPRKRMISKHTNRGCPLWENIKRSPEPSCPELN